MHIGKALAKLNAKTVKFDTGLGGGEPEFISTDFAAAIAFVPQGLGRELMLRIWWPDGAVPEKQISAAIEQVQLTEWKRREDRMINALLIVATQGGTKGQNSYAGAHAARWPTMIKREFDLPVIDVRYAGIRKAVLKELDNNDICPKCKGHCVFTDANDTEIECLDCLGTGRKKASNRWRAQESGITWFQYQRDGWSKVYEWTLGECRAMLIEAEKSYAAALATT